MGSNAKSLDDNLQESRLVSRQTMIDLVLLQDLVGSTEVKIKVGSCHARVGGHLGEV